MFRSIFFASVCVVLSATACAAAGRLTSADLDRVRELKKLIAAVDTKSLEQTVREIERATDPQLMLKISEAMARVYADIERDQQVTDSKTREWLYSLVALNMATMQFGGKPSGGKDGALNRMITRKLKEYLSSDVFANPHFHVSVE